MVRNIQQFQKLHNHASDSLTPYQRQELYAQLPLWEECLNACKARLYVKSRKDEVDEYHSWREHPFDSFACFVKNHKNRQYSIKAFDIHQNGTADPILDLALVTAGEYRILYLRGAETVCFASSNYIVGVSPVDTETENENFLDNVQSAIGHWWYMTRRHNWKEIDKAAEKMLKKTEGMQVATLKADPAPVRRARMKKKPEPEPVVIPVPAESWHDVASKPTEEEDDFEKLLSRPVPGDTPEGPLAVVYVSKPPEKPPRVKLLPYEVSAHHSHLMDPEPEEVKKDESIMVLLSSEPQVPPEGPCEVETRESALSTMTESQSMDSSTWSENLATPAASRFSSQEFPSPSEPHRPVQSLRPSETDEEILEALYYSSTQD